MTSETRILALGEFLKQGLLFAKHFMPEAVHPGDKLLNHVGPPFLR